MQNKIQDGQVLSLPAPFAVNGGDLVVIGALAGVAMHSAAQGELFSLAREGVFELPKVAVAVTLGQRLYYDAAAKKLTPDGSAGLFVGAAGADAIAGDALVSLVLSDCPSEFIEGQQPAIPDITTANAADLATAQALANATKVTVNALLASLRAAGIIKT